MDSPYYIHCLIDDVWLVDCNDLFGPSTGSKHGQYASPTAHIQHHLQGRVSIIIHAASQTTQNVLEGGWTVLKDGLLLTAEMVVSVRCQSQGLGAGYSPSGHYMLLILTAQCYLVPVTFWSNPMIMEADRSVLLIHGRGLQHGARGP